jgi:hypothetical protein
MGKRTLIIIFATLLLFAVGGLGAYIIVIPAEQETKPTQVTEPISPSQEVADQPEETIKQPESPTITESFVDISDWETWRDEYYGFEFKYPKNWHGLCKQEEAPCIYWRMNWLPSLEWVNSATLEKLNDPKEMSEMIFAARFEKELPPIEGARRFIMRRYVGAPPEFEEKGVLFVILKEMPPESLKDCKEPHCIRVPAFYLFYNPHTASEQLLEVFNHIVSSFRVFETKEE